MSPTILRGVAWQTGITVVARASRWLTLLVLGGLLDPAEFGRFAALYVIIDGLLLLQGFGLGPAFVVRRDRVDESAESTFWLSAGAGIAFTGLAWVAAPWLAEFYRDASLTDAFRALALSLLFASLRVVPLRLVERDLAFSRKVVPTAVGVALYCVVAMVLAWRGAGVWSLVGATLAAAAGETLAYWATTNWRPRGRIDWGVAREDLRFGIPVATGAMLAFGFQAIDRVFLGRHAGVAGLGPYAFSHSLTTMPLTSGVVALNTVLLPSYGRKPDARSRAALFLRSLGVVAGFGGLFVAGVLGVGVDALRAAYGEKWLAAEPILRWLAIGAVLRAMCGIVGEYLVGSGRPGDFRTINLVQLGLAGALIAPAFTRFGISGVAITMVTASAVAFVAGLSLAAHHAPVPGGALVRPLLPALASFGAAFAFVTGLRPMLPSFPADWIAWGAGVVLVHLAVWWITDPAWRGLVRGRLLR